MRTAVVLSLALAAGGTATQALRDRDSEIRAALPPSGQSLSDAERRRVETIVARIVDTRQILESALGKRWAALTPKERQRLLEAFERRFRTSGGARLDDMREARIEYLAERREGSLVVVPTRVTVHDETSEVTYSMRQTGSVWRIVDIVIDDVSTVENYRASFARVIGREGIDSLIHRLERGSEVSR